MSEQQPATPPAESASPAAARCPEHWLSELAMLLRELEGTGAAHCALPPVLESIPDNQLAQVRLGTASSLFAALQFKHAATAAHSLRVALTCSAWAVKLGLTDAERDAIEIAALLHDVGMIGVPDHILAKPGPLDDEEVAMVRRARGMSVEILRHSCAAPTILRIVECACHWYDAAESDGQPGSEALPLGARMIAVAEAFDAMTTEQIFRPAHSHERALAELFECAGTQFDPTLVRAFADFHDGDHTAIQREAAGRWLQTLDPRVVDSYWELAGPFSPPVRDIDSLFEAKLLENMYDAVVFINAAGRITLWNRGAERLTGISAAAMRQRTWQPEMLRMADEKGRPVLEVDCPVGGAIRSGVQSLRRLTICSRNGRDVAVDTHSIPVTTDDGRTVGAILLFHDASSEISLEQRCQSLHEKATRDPLTQVANRAEFDRVHETFVAAHRQQRVPCSLMICDLDRFKRVNDTYGHQAGDEAIKSLASLLKSSCRPGDLVARYGGEEFVMLCADCDNVAATRRAEQLRKTLSEMPQSQMGGQPITASFGVTEIQPGDTPATMLRRADRALLMAKNKGRNTVVQLGSGSPMDELAAAAERRDTAPRRRRSGDEIEQRLVTPVPLRMAVEKLRGFVADHQARVVSVDGLHVRLEIDEQRHGRMRRLADRPVSFQLDVSLEEQAAAAGNVAAGGSLGDTHEGAAGSAASRRGVTRTHIDVVIAPRKVRERRREDVERRAREVLASLRSYLMAVEESAGDPSALERAKRIISPWLAKRA